MWLSSRARASRRPGRAASGSRRATAAALVAIVAVSAGCTDLSRSFLASVRLSGELQEDCHERIVVARIPSGGLYLTAEPSTPEEQKMRPGIDRVRALRIAKFARAHYADTAGLREITVILASNSKAVPVQQRHVYSGGTWRLAALDSLPDPGATNARADVQE